MPCRSMIKFWNKAECWVVQTRLRQHERRGTTTQSNCTTETVGWNGAECSSNWRTCPICPKHGSQSYFIKSKQPLRLHEILKRTYYSERRNAGKGLFYDSSKTVPGRQSLQNRLKHIAQISEPWNEQGPEKFSKDKLRVMLKSTYFIHKATFQAVTVTTL